MTCLRAFVVFSLCVLLAACSSGPPRRVLAESPSFAPQVTKVLGPPWLVVEEVAEALGGSPGEAGR